VDDTPQPLTEHLAELRRRIAVSLAAWLAAAVASWGFREQIFAFLLQPALVALGPSGSQLQAIAPTEIFFTYLKCALLAGFVAALPVIFWQLWAFVAPGLYDQEKRVALPFVLASTALFLAGCAFGQAIAFPQMFRFFAGFQSEFVVAAWTMREVFSLTTHFFLAFGIAFELPILVVLLALAGIVDARQLVAWSGYAVLLCFAAGAILTPTPDLVGQFFLSVPLLALYYVGVAAAWLVGFRRARRESREASALQPH
jgi:sec-independent protein translocase protein TatC